MKKKLKLIIAIVCAIALCGCSADIIQPPDYSDKMTLGDYSNLTYEINESQYTVTKEIIEYALKMQYYDSIEPIKVSDDRGILYNDIVTIEYTCTIDGKITETTGTSFTKITVGERPYMQDFDAQLINHKIDDELTFDIEYTDVAPKTDYIGKTATYWVKINNIETKDVPVDEEFITKYTKYSNYEKMTKAMTKSLEKDAEEAKQEAIFSQYMAQITERSEYKELVNFDATREAFDKRVRNDVANAGITFEKYLKDEAKLTEEDYDAWLKMQTEYYIKTRMAACEIARKENIKLTSSEFETYKTKNYGTTDMSSIGANTSDVYIDYVCSKVKDYLLDKNLNTQNQTNAD